MKRQLITLMIVLGAGVVASWYLYRNAWSTQGTIIRVGLADGIIMDSTILTSMRRDDTWFITRADVVEFEQALDEALADTNRFGDLRTKLPKYYRQYYARTWNRQRTIRAEFFSKSAMTRYQWLHRTPVLQTPTRQHWTVEYALDSGKFVAIDVPQ